MSAQKRTKRPFFFPGILQALNPGIFPLILLLYKTLCYFPSPSCFWLELAVENVMCLHKSMNGVCSPKLDVGLSALRLSNRLQTFPVLDSYTLKVYKSKSFPFIQSMYAQLSSLDILMSQRSAIATAIINIICSLDYQTFFFFIVA